jgi:hypothetical protein
MMQWNKFLHQQSSSSSSHAKLLHHQELDRHLFQGPMRDTHTHTAIQCLSLLVWWEFCGAFVSAFLVVADLKFCKSPSIQRFMMPAFSLHSSFVSFGQEEKVRLLHEASHQGSSMHL